MQDLDGLLTLLAHPLTLALAALPLAGLLAALLGAQLRALGLDRRAEAEGRFAWAGALAAWAFWLFLALGWRLAAERGGQPELAFLLDRLVDALLGLLPGGLILAGAAHARAAWLRDAADRRDLDPALARDRADLALVAAGLLAAASLSGQALSPLLLVVGLGTAAWWVLRDPERRRQAEAALDDLRAGQALRAAGIGPGAVLADGGRSVEVLGVIGLTRTEIAEGGVRARWSNGELMRLARPALPRPGG